MRKQNNSRGGHCFLFRTPPAEVCYQHVDAGCVDELDLWLGGPLKIKPNESAKLTLFKGVPAPVADAQQAASVDNEYTLQLTKS